MNVLISVCQSFSVMRMHSVSTQLAATSVSAMMSTLETVLPAILIIPCLKSYLNPYVFHRSWWHYLHRGGRGCCSSRDHSSHCGGGGDCSPYLQKASKAETKRNIQAQVKSFTPTIMIQLCIYMYNYL